MEETSSRSGVLQKPGSPSHSASFPSGPRIIPVFTYTVKCRQKCRCSSAQPHFVQVLTPHSAPCRVLSSSKRSLSAPLNSFMYDFTQKAFSNREGYTWTPMYLQHCTKPYMAAQIIDQNWGTKSAKPVQDFNWPSVAADKSTFSWVPDKLSRSSVVRNRPTSYSKFMESPYLNRGLCHSKWQKTIITL